MLEKVRLIIARHCGTDTEAIDSDTHLIKDLALSSLDVVNLVVEFEDTFDIDIPDADIRRFHYIKDVVEYLEELV